MINSKARIDVRHLASGKDGRLFVEIGNESKLLSEIETFAIKMTVNNVDVNFVGDSTTYKKNISYAYVLTFSEQVIRDDTLMKPMFDAIKAGGNPYFDFQGVIIRPSDGQEQRVVCRNCIPDGEIGIMNSTMNEVVKREMTFAINGVPEFISQLSDPLI